MCRATSRSRHWLEEDEHELRQLVEQFLHTDGEFMFSFKSVFIVKIEFMLNVHRCLFLLVNDGNMVAAHMDRILTALL